LKRIHDVFRPVYPTPAGLITCVDEDGIADIVTLGEVYMLALKPLTLGISIRPSRYSHELISASREYVANMPTMAIAEAVDICGTLLGRQVNKWIAANLTPEPAQVVSAPLIAECPLNMECQVQDILSMGSHDVFVGRVVVTHVEDSILDEHGLIDPGKASALAFPGRGYWPVIGPQAPAFAKRS